MDEKYEEGKGFAEERIDHHGVCDGVQVGNDVCAVMYNVCVCSDVQCV